jgi:hypothetical protein
MRASSWWILLHNVRRTELRGGRSQKVSDKWERSRNFTASVWLARLREITLKLQDDGLQINVAATTLGTAAALIPLAARGHALGKPLAAAFTY